jgi:23S rRNA pseudouridine1911/1915/1917 synthase
VNLDLYARGTRDAGSDRQEWQDAIPPMPAVVYEDSELLAVDKPPGLVTHPTYKHPDGTLWDAVLARQLARGEARPCLLHRLDRWTSGVMLFAKTEHARRAVVRQFEQRSVGKRYVALAAGSLAPDEGEIEAPLVRDPLDRRRTIVADGGQPAVTRYRVLARSGNYALVLAEPRTGRTHQIRAHLAWRGAPLVGDTRYLPDDYPERDLAPRVMLHAWQVTIRYPGTGALLALTAPIPADLHDTARCLGLGPALDALDAHDQDPAPADYTE